MAINSCPECNGKVSTLASSCPHCGILVTPLIGAPEKTTPVLPHIQMKCPNCSQAHEYPANAAGRKGRCNKCGTAYRISSPDGIAVARAQASTTVAKSEPEPPRVAQVGQANVAVDQAPTSDSTVRARAINTSRAALARAGAAANDTAVALGILLRNPTQGLAEAFEKLGSTRALQVGLVCGAIFDLSVLVCLVQLVRVMVGGFSEGFRGHPAEVRMPSLPLEAYTRGALAAAIPLASIALSMTVTRSICRGKGSLAGDIFVAGIALMPFAVVFLAFSVLGFANIEVVLILLLTAECFLALTLFHGFKDLGGLSPNFAAFAVPAAILVSAYLVKVFGTALIPHGLSD